MKRITQKRINKYFEFLKELKQYMANNPDMSIPEMARAKGLNQSVGTILQRAKFITNSGTSHNPIYKFEIEEPLSERHARTLLVETRRYQRKKRELRLKKKADTQLSIEKQKRAEKIKEEMNGIVKDIRDVQAERIEKTNLKAVIANIELHKSLIDTKRFMNRVAVLLDIEAGHYQFTNQLMQRIEACLEYKKSKEARDKASLHKLGPFVNRLATKLHCPGEGLEAIEEAVGRLLDGGGSNRDHNGDMATLFFKQSLREGYIGATYPAGARVEKIKIEDLTL